MKMNIRYGIIPQLKTQTCAMAQYKNGVKASNIFY